MNKIYSWLIIFIVILLKMCFKCLRKGRIHINRLHLHYTSEMEKAMHQAHGVGYEVYSRKLNVRLQVEEKREEDYRKSQMIINDLERKAFA